MEQSAHSELKMVTSTSRIAGSEPKDLSVSVLPDDLYSVVTVTDTLTTLNSFGRMELPQILTLSTSTATCLHSRKTLCPMRWILTPSKLSALMTLKDNIQVISADSLDSPLAPTFTAHPKPDPETGELVTWGYQAKGDGTTDVCYVLFSKEGKKLEECWFHAPYAGLMHDAAITPNYVVFQIYPHVADLDRIKKGGLYFQYDETLPMYLGLLPKRNPKPEDIKWFQWDPDHFEGHVSNAFEKNGKVYVDFPVFKGNVFYFFPNKDGYSPPPQALTCRFPRFELDPNATDLRISEPEYLGEVMGEFSRIDERFQGL